MKSFPMFIDVVGRSVAIVGGGEQAAQKARLILKTQADIVLIAPELDAELAGLVASGRARHVTASYDAETVRAARFAFICTGCAGADAACAAIAKSDGVLVNVVDRPELCDLVTPAIVDRDPLVVAIGTEGAAPVLARQVKTKLEAMLEPRLGEFTALAGRLRAAVAQKVSREKRRAFWRWAFAEAPRRMFAAGQEAHAAALLKQTIEQGGPADEDSRRAARGFVSIVGAGPGAADLMTLRGVQRLQEADVIFYDRLVGEDVLELARRDAERVYVGKAPGEEAQGAWPQDRINGVVTAAARAGQRVVRLKCGDPLVFGRAAEEAAACEAAGVEWEIVPGVTAALAAAAAVKLFPTARGDAQSFTLATGASAAGRPDPDFSAVLRPGATAAFYMGVAAAGDIEHGLLSSGAPADAAVTIVQAAETANARRLVCALIDLRRTVEREGVKSPAIIFVTWPHPIDAAQTSELSAVG